MKRIGLVRHLILKISHLMNYYRKVKSLATSSIKQTNLNAKGVKRGAEEPV